MSSLLALYFLSYTTFKNRLKESWRKPWVLLFYLASIGSFGATILLLPRMERVEGELSYWFLPTLGIGVLTIYILITLSASTRCPISFSLPDVNILFPTPISPRLIAGWRLLNRYVFLVIAAIPITFLLLHLGVTSFNLPSNPEAWLISALAIWLLTATFFTYSYFVFLVTIRFNLAPILRKVGVAILLLIFGFIYLSLKKFTANELFAALTKTGEVLWPLVWHTSPLIAVFSFGDYSGQLYLNLFFLLSLAGITLVFAKGFYEVAALTAIETAEITAAMKNMEWGTIARPKLPKAGMSLERLLFLKGEWALLWRKIAESSRTWKKDALSLLITFGISFAVVVYFSKFQILPVLFIAGGSLFRGIIEGLPEETRRYYILQIPGKSVNKLLAISIYPIVVNFFSLLCAWIPVLFVGEMSFPLALTVCIWLAPLSFCLQLSNSLAHLFVPFEPDRFAYFSIVLLSVFGISLFPAIVIGALLYAFSGFLEVGFGVFLGLTVSIFALLAISAKRFHRIELTLN